MRKKRQNIKLSVKSKDPTTTIKPPIINKNSKTFIIAEIGSNHNGDFGKACRLIKLAAKAGADAVKFQAFSAEKIIVKNTPTLSHVSGKHKSQFDRFKSLEFTEEQYKKLAKLCKENGIYFMATPFDKEKVDMLDPLMPVFKIASGDFTDLPLIRHILKKNKQIFLSTGMATSKEIERVLKYIPKNRLVLLHCVSNYPVAAENANLLAIQFLRDKYKVIVGYSDHCVGILSCLVAVALGAKVIEKHFTFDKTQKTGDHKLSADYNDMKEMVETIRNIETRLGKYGKNTGAEKHMLKLMRRSLVAAVDIPKGKKIKRNMLISLRPGKGISPMDIDKIVGRKAVKNIKANTVLKWKYISKTCN